MKSVCLLIPVETAYIWEALTGADSTTAKAALCSCRFVLTPPNGGRCSFVSNPRFSAPDTILARDSLAFHQWLGPTLSGYFPNRDSTQAAEKVGRGECGSRSAQAHAGGHGEYMIHDEKPSRAVSVWSGPFLWVGVRVMYPHSVMWIHS